MSDTWEDAAQRMYLMESDSDSKDYGYLYRLLKDGETSKVEVKLSLDGPKDNIAKAICGIANQRGGRVIIGLAEKKFYKPEMGIYSQKDMIGSDFILFGIKNTDRARIELSSHLRSNTNLGTNLEDLYSVSELTINSKKVVIIKVKPYFIESKKVIIYKNEIFKRIDNQTVRLTMTDLVDIFNGGSGINNSHSIDTTSVMEAIEENKDIIYDAVNLVIEANKASTSLLQRRLRIGYGRSARLIDRLERAGIIGPAIESKPREILIKDFDQAKKSVQDMDK